MIPRTFQNASYFLFFTCATTVLWLLEHFPPLWLVSSKTALYNCVLVFLVEMIMHSLMPSPVYESRMIPVTLYCTNLLLVLFSRKLSGPFQQV